MTDSDSCVTPADVCI